MFISLCNREDLSTTAVVFYFVIMNITESNSESPIIITGHVGEDYWHTIVHTTMQAKQIVKIL